MDTISDDVWWLRMTCFFFFAGESGMIDSVLSGMIIKTRAKTVCFVWCLLAHIGTTCLTAVPPSSPRHTRSLITQCLELTGIQNELPGAQQSRATQQCFKKRNKRDLSKRRGHICTVTIKRAPSWSQQQLSQRQLLLFYNSGKTSNRWYGWFVFCETRARNSRAPHKYNKRHQHFLIPTSIIPRRVWNMNGVWMFMIRTAAFRRAARSWILFLNIQYFCRPIDQQRSVRSAYPTAMMRVSPGIYFYFLLLLRLLLSRHASSCWIPKSSAEGNLSICIQFL